MNIVFLHYNYIGDYDSPVAWINKIRPFTGVMEELSKKCKVTYIGQLNYEGEFEQGGVIYRFLNPKRFKRFPTRLHRTVKEYEPDIVIIPGFHFPLQVIQLKQLLGKKVKIIAEHHADKPPSGLKRIIQRWADKRIDAYHFTSIGNALSWLKAGIIRNPSKCREIPAGTTDFRQLQKQESKQILGMGEGPNFVCVGRLNANKDPLTVLDAFEKYIKIVPTACLYMIYQEKDMLDEIIIKLSTNDSLKNVVILQGYVSHDELPKWLSAADYFVSASHSEGGSIALMEAMACGCIPVTTNIPAALAVTESGKYGLHFSPGNAAELYDKLVSLQQVSRREFSDAVRQHFEKELSFEAIARKLYYSCEQLITK